MVTIAPEAMPETPIAADPARFATGFRDNPGAMVDAVTSELVKGVGYYNGGSKPEMRPEVLAPAAMNAGLAIRKAVKDGYTNPQGVISKTAPEFQPLLQRVMLEGSQMSALAQQVSQVLTQELK